MHMQQECLSATWSEKARWWTLRFRDANTGAEYSRTARYLITATGVFNIPKGLQDLPVLEEFNGLVFHTSQWREADFAGKRVLVIGNGCSANQVIPWILDHERPEHVTQIFRSEQWIAPKGNYKHSIWFRR